MNKFIKQLLHIVTLNIWLPLSKNGVPKWVKLKSEGFYNRCKVRPYNKVVYFKGDAFIYKVWFEMVGQGQIKDHFYRKLRTK